MAKSMFRVTRKMAMLVTIAITLIALVFSPGWSGPVAAKILAAPDSATYTITMGSKGAWSNPDDTPSFPYIDKDGAFYFQSGHSLYGANDSRQWVFYSGTNFNSYSANSTINNYVNPNNSNDKNNDTTWRCNNSPTGLTATYDPSGGYSQKNFCDVVGLWVDPDTGDWYGLVHNEFTGSPFGDGSHYDAIDVAVSTNQGKVWTITNHIITSPFSTARSDTTAFPNQTYYYGDGDPRLLVDYKTGYFYTFYASRIINKSGGWYAFGAHVARAPISSKMASGSWQKWYNGAWNELGLGGKESTMMPVDNTYPNGYAPTNKEYNPANTGTAGQQISAGLLRPTSPLVAIDVAYDAYLGLYIGEPQAVDQSGNSPQYYYVTDDLTTQKWYLIGNSGSYHTASWYRWFLDSANKTNNQIVGKSFRTYCSIGCSNNSSSEYINITIDSSAPAAVIDVSKTYNIQNADGRILAQVSGGSTTTSAAAPGGSTLEQWTFTSNGDGSYKITNVSSGQLLGVDSSNSANRAWGAKPTVTTSNGTVGQQWFVWGTRLVNRYSGLVLALSSDSNRLAETTPYRNWTNATGNSVGGTRVANEQSLTFAPVGTAPTPAPTATSVAGAFTSVRYFPRSGQENRMVGGKFQGSNTSPTSGFVDLGTISSTPPSGQWSTLSWSNGTVYRYVRYLSPTGGWGNVAELEFYAGAAKLTGAGFGTAGSYNNLGDTFDKALDGNTSTFFDCATGDGCYVGLDTGVSGPTATPTKTPIPPTATPTATGVYTQNFDSGIGGWTRMLGSGTVAVENGQLSIDAASTNTLVVDNNSPSYANGTVQYTVTPQNTSGRTLLVFRYTSTTSWAAVGYDLNGNWVWVNGSGSYGNLVTGGTALASGTTYTVKITYSGSSVTIWLNGAQLYTGAVSQLPTGAGKIGFRDWNTAHVHYDNVSYTTP